MKDKKLMIATCASSAVAALAIVALVLCLTGVIPSGNNSSPAQMSEADKWREAAKNAPENAGMYSSQVCEYLEGFCTFEVDTSEAEYGTIWYRYIMDDGRKVSCMSDERQYDFIDDIDITSYSYSQDGKPGWADIGNPDDNESPDSMERYADFLDWCEEIGLTPKQIMNALDWCETEYKLEQFDNQYGG